MSETVELKLQATPESMMRELMAMIAELSQEMSVADRLPAHKARQAFADINSLSEGWKDWSAPSKGEVTRGSET